MAIIIKDAKHFSHNLVIYRVTIFLCLTTVHTLTFLTRFSYVVCSQIVLVQEPLTAMLSIPSAATEVGVTVRLDVTS